jgi:predicted amidohydrolase YtcJ
LLEERTALDAGRLRIEHFSYASDNDIERAARLGVVLSIQPNFVAPDDHGVAMEDARVGEHADTVYAWGSLDRAGAVMAFGSDYFTFPFPPLFTLYAAVTRANLDGLPADGWHPDQRLERDASLRAMVTTHEAGGTARTMAIAPSEPARLVILDRDPRSATPAEWLETRVLATIHDGRVVFSEGSLVGLSEPPR